MGFNSITHIDSDKKWIDMLVCGKMMRIRFLQYGVAVGHDSGKDELYIHFDTLNDALIWFLNEHKLWVKE